MVRPYILGVAFCALVSSAACNGSGSTSATGGSSGSKAGGGGTSGTTAGGGGGPGALAGAGGQPIGRGGATSLPPSMVQRVSVSPSSVTLTAPDGTQQLSATAYDATGKVVSGVSFDWVSSDSGVADVSSNGLVHARAAGTAVITALATCCNTSGTTSVTVQQQASPNLVENFSTYTSTANFLSDPRNIYSQNEDEDPADIVLDTTVGYGSSDRSMRFDYQASGATKNSETVGRNLTLASAQSELWVEVWAEFSSNFTTVPTWLNQILPYNPDFKFVFGRMSSGSGRFEFKEGNSTNTELSAGYPGNQEAYLGDFSMNSKALWDGKWHRYRFHWKVGSGDGVVQVWIDNSLEISHANLTMSDPSDAVYSIALGRNLDPSASQLQHIWWGSVKVWYQGNNPGW